MIRFTAGIALLIFSLLYGGYQFFSNRTTMNDLQMALQESLDKRDQGKDLQERLRSVRRISLVNEDAPKFNLERVLEIGAPRLEWRFLCHPMILRNRAMYRYSFRVSGPSSAEEVARVLAKMNTLPGFVPTRYCLNCSQPPRGTDSSLRMVIIEGFLYAYDPGAML